MKSDKLTFGMHLMNVFGDEFADESFCWMMETGELWLSMIIVKDEHRRNGALHRLLEAAKDMSNHVIIPEPMNIVPIVAAKHGYVSASQYIADYGERIDTMEWCK
ncbi:MAG: hypothetical protein JRI71_10145 [Deltaproteobacteria bacterium]|nr:hypothetical protein [Deltaproteobacteria bacterium]